VDPNQPLHSLVHRRIGKIYRRTKGWPDKAAFYEKTAGRLPFFRRVDVEPAEEGFLYATNKEQLHLPAPDIAHVMELMSMGYYIPSILNRYTMKGFVSVQPGDLVVDCGAFVGGFSLGVRRIAGSIHCIEPSPSSFAALEKNMAATPNATCWNIGFYSEAGVFPMNISSTHVDNSVLDVDEGETIAVVKIDLNRLDRWAIENQIDRIDFLKLEAEGVEPEIAESIGDLPIAKIAADCSPERNGQPTGSAVTEILRSKGFECRSRGDMVFAVSTAR
jgi:FkbM family methyltransferase